MQTVEGPRILMVVTDTDRRGAQVFATDLHQALERLGHAVRTVALAPGATGGLALPQLGPSRQSLRTLRALRAEMRRADVVVAHGSTTLPMCAIAGIATGTPFVYRQISDSLFWASSRARRLRTSLGLRRAAHVVSLWSGAAAVLRDHFGLRADKITVIPNGVPAERFALLDDRRRADARRDLDIEPAVPVVAYVGALAAEKGLDTLLEALAGEAVPTRCRLLVAGDGPERARFEALAARRLPGRVSFLGSVPDPVTVYAAADLLAFPSRGGDSMPAVLIEAALCGLPIVATDTAAVPEMVPDRRGGRIVAPDDPVALATAIGELLASSELRARLAAGAREHALEHYEIGPVARSWLTVLDRVARRTG